MLKQIKSIVSCTKTDFLLWKRDPRIVAVGVFVLAYMIVMLWPVRRFSAAVGIAVSPWCFPFLMFQGGTLVLMSCATVLFCNAPFGTAQLPFILLRTGRFQWIIGQLLYIFLASLVYTVFVLLSSIAVLFPYVRFTGEWGTIIDTIFTTRTPYEMGYPIALQGTAYVYSELKPLQAVFLSTLLFYLSTLLLGVVAFFGNLVSDRMLGVYFDGILICLSAVASIAGQISPVGTWIYYISPISWSSLNGVVLHDAGKHPHIGYAVTIMVVLLVALGTASVWIIRKKNLMFTKGGNELGGQF